MIADLQPHPSYKNSKVEWLGEVPEHWELRRFKKVAILNPSKTESRQLLSSDTPVTFLPMERVGTDGKIDMREIVPASKIWNGFTYFKRDDILVAKITPCFENGKGGCLDSLPTLFGFGSTEFHVLRSGSLLSPQFLYRITTIQELRRLGAEMMTGAAGQQRVPNSFLANITIPLPPLPEQNAIVRYLDYMDRRIRRLISAKKKLIALLEEEKQAIIHNAVTRGLDPNVRLKPSGVEWLGDVPEHWEIIRLKLLIEKITDGEHITPQLSNTGIPLLSAKDIRDRTILYNVDKYVNLHDAELYWKRCCPESNDLLIVSRGATIGRIALVKEDTPFCLMGSVILCKSRNDYDTDYLYYALNSQHAQTSLWFSSASSAQQAIYIQDVKELHIPIPPLSERNIIVKFLEGKLMNIFNTITHAQRQITLLEEYRTRLIADVVTGKLDVREAAAHLPDESEEVGPPDELDSMGDDEASANELGFEEETEGTGEWPVE